MNANALINMVTRMFVRKIVGRGVDAGINAMAGRGKPQQDMSKEEKAQAKRAKQAMRVTRRVTKF